MPYFRRGDCLRLGGERVVVEGFIAGGSQADVYRVLNVDRKENMAMKHLYGKYANDTGLFYRKVKLLTDYPAPHPRLVWPEAVSRFDPETGTFAYLMKLLPSDYKPIAYIMKRPEIVGSVQKKQLAVQLAEVFSTLHRRGFIYSDISADNIYYWIDEAGQTDIRVIDCDNVSIREKSLGLFGTELFRAPEVILGAVPTESSDAHALAVALFRMMVGCHPLDGIYTHSIPFTPQMIEECFGRRPEYIFSENGTNGPAGKRYVERFESLSPQLQLFFNVMFSSRCLHDPNKRPTADMLLTILQRF